MSESVVEKGRRQGRPRDPAADEAIIAAVLGEIEDSGFAGFSVEAVAARAGVGKATIYRRWPTREDLLIAAADRVMTDHALPDTGTLEGDLVEWFSGKYQAKRDAPSARLLGQVIVEARVNPELTTLMKRFHEKRRATLSHVVERAKARGEIDSIDTGLLLDLISGALLHRSVFGERDVHHADVAEIVDAALRGVDAHRSA